MESSSTSGEISAMNKPATWYTKEHASAWERIKAAFANDWEQTKHDFGSKTARDLDQDVDDTIKQAMRSEDAFENHEQAFRFGYAARSQHQDRHPQWNDELDRSLRDDFKGDYETERDYIRYAYQYRR
jgi:hypothetical protein